MTATHEQVADAFIGLIQEWLTDEELAEVDRRNEADPFCHVSDFCDANEAMEYAMEHHGVQVWTDEDEINNETCDFWNTAWSIATKKGFSK